MLNKILKLIVVCFFLCANAFCAAPRPEINQGETRVTFFDVGQGNCTLIEGVSNQNPRDKFIILIDGGSSQNSRHSVTNIGGGANVIHNTKPQMISQIVTQIRNHFRGVLQKDVYIILSHPDNDHFNLIADILGNFKNVDLSLQSYLGGSPENWGMQRELLAALKRGNVTYAEDRPAPNINLLSQGTIDFLFWTSNPVLSDFNSKSLVIKYDFGNISALIPGDATQQTLNAINQQYHSPITIALASHHGSKDDCNTQAWVDMFTPSYVVFSTAANNDGYKHPALEVIERYLQRIPVGAPAVPHNLTFYGDFTDLLTQQAQALAHHIIPSVNHIFGPGNVSVMPFNHWFLKVQKNLSQPLYSTADSGDIKFTWSAEARHPTITSQYPIISSQH